jgi:hypothetical protein
MKVTVHIYPSNNGHARRSETSILDVPCGSGEQLVRWLGFAACLRLAYIKRDTPRRYLPITILNKDGLVVDVDLVLKEVVKDGDELYVEYGIGPQAYTAKWEGRPETPEFIWGEDGVVHPPHDLWLSQLDLEHERIDQLVDKHVREHTPENLKKDLDAVKALMTQHAGSLQACFLVFECQVGTVEAESHCVSVRWLAHTAPRV